MLVAGSLPMVDVAGTIVEERIAVVVTLSWALSPASQLYSLSGKAKLQAEIK